LSKKKGGCMGLKKQITKEREQLIKRVWQERNEFAMKHNGKIPDNITLHPCQKKSLFLTKNYRSGYLDAFGDKFFDMKLIFDNTLGKDEIIYGYYVEKSTEEDK